MALKLHREIIGISGGNFSPKSFSSEGRFAIRVSEACSGYAIEKIFLPRPDFTNKIAVLGQDCESICDNVFRTKGKADGGIVEEKNMAIGFLNADCPIICLQEGERLAVLHGGYRCLIRKDETEPNIIESAMKHFDKDKVKVWMGFGIGPCCWVPEYDDKPEILAPNKSKYFKLLRSSLSVTNRNSPFGERKISIDLYKLVLKIFWYYFCIRLNNNDLDRRCTCCAERKVGGSHIYWSHTRFQRYGGVDGRNLSFAFLAEE